MKTLEDKFELLEQKVNRSNSLNVKKAMAFVLANNLIASKILVSKMPIFERLDCNEGYHLKHPAR
jgi:hypothetical protein